MLDRRVRFRHLQCFLAVAELGSVVQAAEALAISQPAVSRALGELEEALEVVLFDRRAKGMVLTRFGTIFLKHASVSVESLRHGIEDIAAAKSDGSAGVAIAVLPNVAPKVVPLAMARFHGRYPNAAVRVLDGTNMRTIDLLRSGEIDLVVGRLSQPEYVDDVRFEPLYLENITAVARACHPLVKGSVSWGELGRYPMILPDQQTNIGLLVRHFLMARGVTPPLGVIETVCTDFARGYALVADAVWFVPRGVVGEQLTSGALVELPIDFGDMEGPIGITTRIDSVPTGATQALIEAIRLTVRNLFPTGRNCSEASASPARE